MKRYFALLEKEPDTVWGVSFPDLPGCVSSGDTADQALANAGRALREFLEDTSAHDEEVAPPSSLEQLQALEEVRVLTVAGAALVAVPVLVDRGRTVRANITVDAGSLEAIDAAARARGLTRSAFMVTAALEKAQAV
jgi:predicted RNase H-like HicB family nuclease